MMRATSTLLRHHGRMNRLSFVAAVTLRTQHLQRFTIAENNDNQLRHCYSTLTRKHNHIPETTLTKAPLALRKVPNDEKSSSYSTTSMQQQQEMKDEYGTMDDAGDTFVYDGDFVLENGQVLPQAQLRYQTYGTLNEETRDNVLVVCHALTGNASLHSWWGGLLGDGLAFDTSKYFVVCCNILGSCYGSTGPMSINPTTLKNQVYGLDFPDVSVQDTVRLQLTMLQQELGIQSIKAVIGGSFGGMQALEYAVQAGGSDPHSTFHANDATDETQQPQPFVRSVIPIACGAAHTAWQIAISEVQRQAIYKDAQWQAGNFTNATDGLEVARQIGMVSYRTAQGYTSKFNRKKQQPKNGEQQQQQPNHSPEYGSDANWQVKSYLEYQGQKFLNRFDPVTYVKMTEQMDSHDVARGRAPSTNDVLATIPIPALVMGIDSDVLYPLWEQEHLAEHLPNSDFKVIRGDDGHDGFLLEQDQVGGHIIDFLKRIA